MEAKRIELLADVWTTVTFPNRPLPVSTPLFSNDKVIDDYIANHVKDFNLSQYIHLNHTIISMTLSAEDIERPWTLQVQHMDPTTNQPIIESKRYSTVIIGTGITPSPKIVTWPGQAEWLAATPNRAISHSMWYRTPDFAKGRFVVVVGYHPSGAHIAKALAGVAREVREKQNLLVGLPG